jgi:16S rRNA processing protein RimM
VEVGRIVGAFGIKGELKIKAFAADPQALFSSKRWFLRRPTAEQLAATARGAVPASSGSGAASSAASGAAPGAVKRPVAAAPPSVLARRRQAAAALLAPLPSPLRVQRAREQGDAVVATAHDIIDRNAAEALVGCSIWISRASFPTPGVDEFYWVDLIGLEVANREGVAMGTVLGLVETGPTCVLRVAPAGAKPTEEALIPFVAAYVDTVDLPGRRITVDWQADY